MTASAAIEKANLIRKESAGALPLAPLIIKEGPKLFRDLENFVCENWGDLSPKDQDVLKELAYSLIEPPRNLATRLKAIPMSLQLAWAVMRGQITSQDMAGFYQSALSFARAVLDRLEEENPTFKEKVSLALEEAVAGKTSPLTLDELRSAILDG